jgi:large subunit ribosomal protein L6
MSRVGKLPITVPSGVKAIIAGSLLKIEGPKGKLERQLSKGIAARIEEGKLVLDRTDDSKEQKMLHGLERALCNNMVHGCHEGFVKELELIGVGYRADMKGTNVINLALGYSHPIDFSVPKGVTANVIKEGREIFIKLESADRQLVGQTAANIRRLRKPEPYKGKGVREKGEVVKLKAGKAGKK